MHLIRFAPQSIRWAGLALRPTYILLSGRGC